MVRRLANQRFHQETRMTAFAASRSKPARLAAAGDLVIGATLVLLAAAPPTWAADAQPKPMSPAEAKQQRESRAKGLALGQETAQRISEAQLQIADRVLTGDAACE